MAELSTLGNVIKIAYDALVPAASQAEAEAGTEVAIRRFSPLRIKQAIAALGGAGGGVWGSITGTLSDQTDVQAALDAKATIAQGALADTALQPADVGTAAAEDVGAFATAAQGVTADAAVPAALFDAHTILAATSDDTPVALTVGEQTLVGRITSGNIAALTATQVRTLLNVADGAVATVEGTAVLSTGEVGGTKFLREDGDGTSSWQAVSAGISNVVEDTTPQLGGSLDINGQQLTSSVVAASGDEVGFDLALTVNKAAGNYTGIKLDVTETSAPGTDNRLLTLSRNGGEIFGFGVLQAAPTRPVLHLTDYSYIVIPNNRGLFLGQDSTNNSVGLIPDQSGGGKVLVGKAGYFGFSSTNNTISAVHDIRLYRDAADELAQRNGTNPQKCKWYGDHAGTTDYQRSGIVTSRTATTVPSAASFTLSGFIPAGALLIGITSRVDTQCTTATGYTVGDGVDVDLWGVAATVTVGTATGSANFTAAGASGVFYPAAQDVVVTATGGNFDGTGVITICGHFLIAEAD